MCHGQERDERRMSDSRNFIHDCTGLGASTVLAGERLVPSRPDGIAQRDTCICMRKARCLLFIPYLDRLPFLDCFLCALE